MPRLALRSLLKIERLIEAASCYAGAQLYASVDSRVPLEITIALDDLVMAQERHSTMHPVCSSSITCDDAT
jgi:hypothetical protein